MSRVVDKNEKTAEILDAAMRVFAKKGAVGTKIQDIATEAGVAKGTIYLYFKNKEEIFKAIMRKQLGAESEVLMDILQRPLDPEKKLRLLIDTIVDSAQNSEYPLEIMPEIWAAVIRSDEKDFLDQSATQMRDIFAVLIKEATGRKDGKKIASGIIALFHGLIIMNIINKDQFPMKPVAKAMLDALMDAKKS